MRRAQLIVLITTCLTLMACGQNQPHQQTVATTVSSAPTQLPTAALSGLPTPTTVIPTTTQAPTRAGPSATTPGAAAGLTTASSAQARLATTATSVSASPTSASEQHDTAELVPSEAPTLVPATNEMQAQPSEPVRIVIDAIGLDSAPVSVGLDANNIPIVPNHEIGWYNLSATPGTGENVVLWGHVLRFRSAPDIPAPFARLKEAQIGDQIVVYTADGAMHSYAISEQVWATPDQVDYILPRGREMLTMVSCIGNKVIVENSVEMTHRLITIAEPIS